MTPPGALRGQRVLVTGAAGFIGRHLVERLHAEGAEVVALDRRTCDLTDRRAVTAAVTAACPDVLLHLAAARAKATTAERDATTAVNTNSGAWLVDALPDHCRAVVRLGSSTEYAESARAMDEDTPLRPRGFFGATKAAGSLLFTAAAAERSVRATVLRAFQVYGPGDKAERFVPTVLAAAASGAVLPLTGPGLRRDWVWVGDVVEACLLAAADDTLPPGATYNLGTGTQTTNEELVRIAEQVTGRPIRTAVGAHAGRSWDAASWVAEPGAARTSLGWKAEVDLAEGLARCWTARTAAAR